MKIKDALTLAGFIVVIVVVGGVIGTMTAPGAWYQGLAKPPFRPVSLAISAALLCVAGYLVFVWGLQMPLTLLGR